MAGYVATLLHSEIFMKTLHFNEDDGNIYWDLSENSSYITPVYDNNDLAYYDVWAVPGFGGKPDLDSHCNNLADAIFQLEAVAT